METPADETGQPYVRHADAWWRSWLTTVYFRSVAEADPARKLAEVWPPLPAGQVIVIAAGKSAERMASAALRHYPHDRVTGLVVTPEPPRVPMAPLQAHTASHPVPDARSVEAGKAVLHAADAAGPNDHVLVLLSGGASSLMVAPRQPLEVEDLARLGSALLRAGAPIADVNLVRRHTDRLKGGGLAEAAHPAPVTLAFASDVIGDDPRIVGSGPATVQPWQPQAAAAVMRQYGLAGDPVTAMLDGENAQGARLEAGKPAVTTRLVSAQDEAVQAAVRMASRASNVVVEVCPDVDEDALAAAARWAANVPEWRLRARAAGRPVVAVSGGEVTVRVAGDGKGGPNSTFAVGFGLALDAHDGIHLLAADTDGFDGVGGHAGGFADATVWRDADRTGAHDAVRRSDTLAWLKARQGAFTTGQTGVNANDLRILVVEP